VQFKPIGEKQMRKAITAVAVLALSGTLAFAATEGHEGFGGHRHGRHHQFGAKMAAKLNLTDAQKTQIKDIRKASREQNAAFFEQAHATRKDFFSAKKANDTAKMESLKPTLQSQRAQMKEIRKAEMSQIKSILTPDQQAMLEQLRAERKARHSDKQ
jgi:periplasmic protein CpxP/Spy